MTWTKITKATGTSWTGVPKGTITGSSSTVPGNPIGLLLAFTYSDTNVVIDGWTKITKASGTNWTNITKAT